MIYINKDSDIDKRTLTGSDVVEEAISQDRDKIPTSKYNSNAIVACGVYLVCSVCMVLINKIISNTGAEAARSDDFPVYFVILFQCFVAVIFVEVAKLLDIIDEYHVTWDICVSLMPLSLLFVCMLCTGFFSLSFCSVPIVTVFKNLTNIIIVTGDVWIFKERYVSRVQTFLCVPVLVPVALIVIWYWVQQAVP